WVARPDPSIRPWSGTLEVLPGVTLSQPGGHFPGSAIVHWAAGAEGRGGGVGAEPRHGVREPGPSVGGLHAQLPEPPAAVGGGGRAGRPSHRRAGVRPPLRQLHQRDRRRRPRGGPPLGEPPRRRGPRRPRRPDLIPPAPEARRMTVRIRRGPRQAP